MKYSIQLFVLTFFFSLLITSNSKFCNELPMNEVPSLSIDLLLFRAPLLTLADLMN